MSEIFLRLAESGASLNTLPSFIAGVTVKTLDDSKFTCPVSLTDFKAAGDREAKISLSTSVTGTPLGFSSLSKVWTEKPFSIFVNFVRPPLYLLVLK